MLAPLPVQDNQRRCARLFGECRRGLQGDRLVSELRKDVLVFQDFSGGKDVVLEFLGNINAAPFKRFRGFLTFQPGGLERFKPTVQLLKGVLLVDFELHCKNRENDSEQSLVIFFAATSLDDD